MRRRDLPILIVVAILLCSLYYYFLHGSSSFSTNCDCTTKLNAPNKTSTLASTTNSVQHPIKVTVRDKFSIIIPTYKRVKLLSRVLTNYCGLESYIDLIVVLWNDLDTPIPDELKREFEDKCATRVVWKIEKVNSLNNRFLPFSEIRTEAVLSADDDLLLSHDDLILQFKSWKRFKDYLVGFAARRHIENPPGSGQYQYIKKVSREDPRYSFILTTSAMFHIKYLSMYQRRIPDEFRAFIDEHMNCEDLLINAVIAEHLNEQHGGLNCPALMVEQKDIKLIEKENVGYKGLWHRKQHKSVREDCLSLIAKHFKGIPFAYSTLKVSRIFPEDPSIPVTIS